MSISKKKLWAKQLEEFPTSVRMTIHEVYDWCDSAVNMPTKLFRYEQISMALQYPNSVFYRDADNRWLGFRFGLNGADYMSMYRNDLLA